MDKTYQALNQNENRAVELKIRDSNGTAFEPTSAFASVRDSDGNIVIEEQEAYVSTNMVYTIIGTMVTSNPGNYDLIWKIVKDSYIYYHVTELEVLKV
jgi:hypothetical protein